MAASVFVYHVVGDLTVGKPELVEFLETDTVESAIKAIGESPEGGISVWKMRKLLQQQVENSEMRQQRFVGILDSLDIVTFLARTECLQDQEMAMNTPVSHVVVPNNSLLRLVDPGTRLIDALEMMKNGVKRLLVPKSVVWKGMSKRFSILYNGKWLKNNMETNNSSSNNISINRASSSSSSSSGTSIRDKFCCLSREDVIRFIIGCLGALAPLPLSSISTLGAINPNFFSIEASMPAIQVIQKRPEDPRAVAIVEPGGQEDGRYYKIIGEISAAKLWKCDYVAAAWVLANLSAGQFVMGVEDNVSPRSFPDDFKVNSTLGKGTNNNLTNGGVVVGGSNRLKRFSSRSICFFGGSPRSPSMSIYRGGRSAPLTCKVTSSLAAVMAQMLSHRATHVWVVTESSLEEEDEDVVVGVVGYADILAAFTQYPPSPSPAPTNITSSQPEVLPSQVQA